MDICETASVFKTETWLRSTNCEPDIHTVCKHVEIKP